MLIDENMNCFINSFSILIIMKNTILSFFVILISLSLAGQDCVQLLCPDSDWYDQQKASIQAEIALGFPACHSGTISQGTYLGQPVYTYVNGSLNLCDSPTSVVDCEGNFLFAYGGFCFPVELCPGFLERQDLMDLELLFSTFQTDTVICPPAEATIPTLGEWSLIQLGLLFLILGILSLKQESKQCSIIRRVTE